MEGGLGEVEADNTWIFAETVILTDHVLIPSLQLTVPLEEIYEGVKFLYLLSLKSQQRNASLIG